MHKELNDIYYKNQITGYELLPIFYALMKEAHSNSVDHGFYPENKSDRNVGEMVALIHAEASELLEALRKPSNNDEHCSEFTSDEIEAADILIRVFDLAEFLELRLPQALLAKMAYNRTRPYKHGKRF